MESKTINQSPATCRACQHWESQHTPAGCIGAGVSMATRKTVCACGGYQPRKEVR